MELKTHARRADERRSSRRAGRLCRARCTCGWAGQGFGKDPDQQWLDHLAVVTDTVRVGL